MSQFYSGNVFKFDHYHTEIVVIGHDIRGVPITYYISFITWHSIMTNWELEPSKEMTQTSRVVFNHLSEITILNDRHICISWLKMDNKLRGKYSPLRIGHSACFKANSYPNCLELNHFNSSPIKAKASKTNNMGGNLSVTFCVLIPQLLNNSNPLPY